LALLVFEGLLLSSVVAKTALNAVQEKIDISVYFKPTAPEDQILSVKRSLEGLSQVKQVEYISRDKALEVFKERHKEDKVITQAVEQLNQNPLSASLNIKANNPDDYSVIAAYLDNNVDKNLVENITYFQNKAVIDRLAAIIKIGRQTGLIAAIFLTLVAILVAFNTILLGIYSNREEISIMRLVGASNLFVRGPFVIMGIIYGFITALLSLLISIPIVFFASPYLKVFIPQMDLVGYFTSHLFSLLLYQILFGVGIGVISSFIAIRRYLRV
jgi:cell division transport system permease protein